MRILAFESSAKAASAAILEDGKLLGEYYQNSGQTHSRTLMMLAENLLRNCDLTPQAIDAVAVAAGPGSFTGVRIGVAAAKGFAWGRELPCCGVSTLEAMAWSAPPVDALIVPAMDARRDQVYCAAFQRNDTGVQQVFADCAISIEELAERLKAVPGRKLLIGDGAKLCYDALAPVLVQLCLAPEHLRFQRASGVALAAHARFQTGEPADAALLRPNYLRQSQAERERARREAQTSLPIQALGVQSASQIK